MSEETRDVLGTGWKIEKRKPRCTVCTREFDAGETHYSGIVETAAGFTRRDFHRTCWDRKTDDLFSYWTTQIPPRREHKLENVQAMIDFFTRLVSEPLQDPLRRKVTYLVSLLLMRRRRLKLLSNADGWLELEQAWNGEEVRIPDPILAEEELDGLKTEMERLFQTETNGSPATA